MTSLTDERDALCKRLDEVDKKISLEKESAAKKEEQRLLDSLNEFENHDAMKALALETLKAYRLSPKQDKITSFDVYSAKIMLLKFCAAMNVTPQEALALYRPRGI